jgi:hypothetical protein
MLFFKKTSSSGLKNWSGSLGHLFVAELGKSDSQAVNRFCVEAWWNFSVV